MTITHKYHLTAFIILMNVLSLYAQDQDKLMQAFLDAKSKSDINKAVKRIIASKIEFDQLYDHLQKGRKYTKEVPTGFLELEYELEGQKYFTLVHIPQNYDPAGKYMVYINLHGGISGSNWRGADRFVDRTNPEYLNREYINVYPSSWKASAWWSYDQSRNLAFIIDRLKQQYNIDENRVHVGGVSDGGTGTFYIANADPTPWAGFSSFIGNFHGLKVLADNQIYVSNFRNKPFLIINTE